MPQPEKDKQYNYTLAATKAFCTVAYNIRIFSDTVLHRYEDSIENVFKDQLPQDVYERSMAFGDTVGKTVLMRAKKDMYKETRGMAKYLGGNVDGKWQPTPPDYFDLISPLPEGVSVMKVLKSQTLDFIHLFFKEKKLYEKEVLRYKKALKPDGMIWISWPKKSSKVPSDMDENMIRNFALKNGLVDVKVCAVNEVWSGLKLVIPVKFRK